MPRSPHASGWPDWLRSVFQPLYVLTGTAIVIGFGPGAISYVLASSMLGLTALEWVFPRRRDWRHSLRSLGIDLSFYWFGGVFVFGPVFEEAQENALIPSLNHLRDTLGVASHVAALPFAAKLLLCILGSELVSYTTHRLSHRFDPIWRLTGHAVHHSSTHMGATRTIVTHPVELCVLALPMLLMEQLLGFEWPEIAAGITFITLTAHTVHCNLPIRTTTWNTVFVSPSIHAHHHSVYIDEQNSNYACALIVLDKLFGTYQAAPKDADVGLAPNVHVSLWRQLLLPVTKAPAPPVKSTDRATASSPTSPGNDATRAEHLAR